MTAAPGSDGREIVEALCERFELAWNTGSAPEIRDFLNGGSPRLRDELLRELIQIDLERRWRASASGSDVELSALPRCPLLDDYVAAFPELVTVAQLPPETIVTEFRVRWSWGDRPELEH